jgi:hypothetical protein
MVACGNNDEGSDIDNAVVISYSEEGWYMEGRTSVDGYKNQTYYFQFSTEMNAAPSKIIVFNAVQENPSTLSTEPLKSSEYSIIIYNYNKIKQDWHLDENRVITDAESHAKALEYGTIYYVAIKLNVDAFLGIRLEK